MSQWVFLALTKMTWRALVLKMVILSTRSCPNRLWRPQTTIRVQGGFWIHISISLAAGDWKGGLSPPSIGSPRPSTSPDLYQTPPIIPITCLYLRCRPWSMATFDDLPGTGRIIDKHFYQPTGRRIERLAVRITFPFLTPGDITHRISGLITQSYFLPRIDVRSQGAILYDISKATFWDGRTVVVGLESLIRQTRWACLSALSLLPTHLGRLAQSQPIAAQQHYPGLSVCLRITFSWSSYIRL